MRKFLILLSICTLLAGMVFALQNGATHAQDDDNQQRLNNMQRNMRSLDTVAISTTHTTFSNLMLALSADETSLNLSVITEESIEMETSFIAGDEPNILSTGSYTSDASTTFFGITTETVLSYDFEVRVVNGTIFMQVTNVVLDGEEEDVELPPEGWFEYDATPPSFEGLSTIDLERWQEGDVLALGGALFDASTSGLLSEEITSTPTTLPDGSNGDILIIPLDRERLGGLLSLASILGTDDDDVGPLSEPDRELTAAFLEALTAQTEVILSEDDLLAQSTNSFSFPLENLDFSQLPGEDDAGLFGEAFAITGQISETVVSDYTNYNAELTPVDAPITQ